MRIISLLSFFLIPRLFTRNETVPVLVPIPIPIPVETQPFKKINNDHWMINNDY